MKKKFQGNTSIYFKVFLKNESDMRENEFLLRNFGSEIQKLDPRLWHYFVVLLIKSNRMVFMNSSIIAYSNNDNKIWKCKYVK